MLSFVFRLTQLKQISSLPSGVLQMSDDLLGLKELKECYFCGKSCCNRVECEYVFLFNLY